MPTYVYEGKNPAGKKVAGEVEARTTDELYRWFRANRVTVTSVRKKRQELRFKIGTGIKLKEIADFARQLAVMIGAGLPLSQCLSVMASQVENKHLREVLRSVSRSVESGSTLADSLTKRKDVFGDLFIHINDFSLVGEGNAFKRCL